MHDLRFGVAATFLLASAVAACSASAPTGGQNDDGVSSGNTGGGGATSGSSTGGGGGNGSGIAGFSPSGSGGSSGGVFSAVDVVITADNAYGFGYGNASSMFNYFGGVEAMLAGEIFNCSVGPESYVVPAEDAAAGNYLYIVAYADKSTTQGVLGQFTRQGGGTTVYTGTPDWEVCPTGQDYSPGSGGPDLNVINAAIPNCTWYDSVGNASGKMQIGEDNTTTRTAVEIGNEFPITCNIDDDARWMWFNWDPTTLDWPNTGSPFIWPGGSNPDSQFLIFRLGADEIPPIPE